MTKSWNSILILVVLLLFALLYSFIAGSRKVEPISVTGFIEELSKGKGTVLALEIHSSEGYIIAKRPDGEGEWKVDMPAPITAENVQLLMDWAGIDMKETPIKTIPETTFKPAPWLLTLLGPMMVFILPVILFGFFYFFMVKQAQASGGQALSFGKSRAKLVTDKPTVAFKDVAGVNEAVEELHEIVEFLKEKKKFIALGARIPKGVLLVGPPGCGKTLLARAIAGEAGVPFFHMSGSDFVEMFVGVGASRVRDLFEQAKRHAPSIIFIDEIDAVGRQRGTGLGGGHDEREQTLNQLLVEMDGFDTNSGVILIAATNRPDVLDPALLRPGRFDRRVTVDEPDYRGREEILIIHSREVPLDDGVDLRVISKQTPGFSGADLRNLVNEAAILAAREGAKKVTMDHFEEATERVMAGPQRKSRVVSPKERRMTAFHEAGHAVAHWFSGSDSTLHKITILPRGRAGGYNLILPSEEVHYYTRSSMRQSIMMALGGRVADELVFGEPTTGASNDLQQVTRIARAMVMEYGMSEKLGTLVFGARHGGSVFLGRDFMEERNYSEEVAYQIDQEVSTIVADAFTEVRRLLTENRATLDRLAEALLEREVLNADEIKLILEGKTLPPEPAGPSTPGGTKISADDTTEAVRETPRPESGMGPLLPHPS